MPIIHAIGYGLSEATRGVAIASVATCICLFSKISSVRECLHVYFMCSGLTQCNVYSGIFSVRTIEMADMVIFIVS